MAIRTTADLVKAVLLRDYDSRNNPGLDVFILTASVLVDDLVTDDENGLVTDTRAELIERWLAAHYYKQSDQALASKSTDGSGGSYQGQTGKGLEGTKYGQTAISIDPTGYLAAIVSGAGTVEVGGIWLGKSASEATTWDERN